MHPLLGAPSRSAVFWDADPGVLFSANRGNISYMCYSFQLFMLGLASSFCLLMPLKWYRRGPDVPISNPHIWEIIIILIGVGGGMSVALAFIFLSLCVQTMDRSPVAQTSATLSLKGAAYIGYGVWLSFRLCV